MLFLESKVRIQIPLRPERKLGNEITVRAITVKLRPSENNRKSDKNFLNFF